MLPRRQLAEVLRRPRRVVIVQLKHYPTGCDFVNVDVELSVVQSLFI
jgi:hypothetical protein